jgi:mannose-6-phosphate isomerase-like protein (cupin superfamily)
MIVPLSYLRIFVDDAGDSHVEDCTLPLGTRNFAPPTTPLEASELMPALGFAVVRFAPDWSGPWHPSPYRQWFFMMSGSLTVTVGDGTERTLCAGDVVLLDDEGTKGHLTRVNGGQQAVAVGVRVPDADDARQPCA